MKTETQLVGERREREGERREREERMWELSQKLQEAEERLAVNEAKVSEGESAHTHQRRRSPLQSAVIGFEARLLPPSWS